LGEKKELACKYIAQGLTRDVVLCICKVSRHQYYYISKGKTRGRKASLSTIKISGSEEELSCSNEEVVNVIEKVKEDPDTNYGYHKMTYHISQMGYMIGHKKVYRLMKEGSLLQEKPLKEAKELYVEIENLNNPKIKEEHIVKIVDFLPKDVEDVSKIFNDISLNEEETNVILALVKKY